MTELPERTLRASISVFFVQGCGLENVLRIIWIFDINNFISINREERALKYRDPDEIGVIFFFVTHNS